MPAARFIGILTLGAAAGLALAGGTTSYDDLTLPVRFRSTLMILDDHPPGTATVQAGGDRLVGDTGTGMTVTSTGTVDPASPRGGTRPAGRSALLTIAIDRWSTRDEVATLTRAGRSEGSHALVKAMEAMTVGYIQVNGELRQPIRMATTWTTSEGRGVRLATSGPVGYPRSALSTDYPIGIVEFTLPPKGRGEGTLVAARRAEFDDRGRIQAVELVMGTGSQWLTNVEREDSRDDSAAH